MYERFIKNQVFLGIPFNTEMEQTEEVIINSCQKFDLNVKTVKNQVGANAIVDDIVQLIEESEFLILDLTQENANVYYELGYADGVGNKGKDILLIAKKNTDIKFDIKHRRVLFYNDSYDLQQKLKKNLPNFIEEGRK